MMRVKDPQRSVEFYKFLGLSLVNKIDMPEWKFCNYFLAYNGPASLQGDRHWTDRNAVLELTHNYGTENDPNYSVVNGNTEPTAASATSPSQSTTLKPLASASRMPATPSRRN